MSLRRVDLRLTLPRTAGSAVVLGPLDSWRAGLEAAGVEVGRRAQAPDLAVAPMRLAREAVATGASMVVVEGVGPVRLRGAKLMLRRHLPLPDLADPDLLLPLDASAPVRYALGEWRPAHSPLKRIRDRAVGQLVAAHAFPPVRPEQIVGSRVLAAPFPVTAASAFGVPPSAGWFMSRTQGDPLTRVAFHLFAPGERRPAWVVKLARVPELTEPFDRDEQGLGLALAAGDEVAARAPRLLGRFVAAGLPASVETAAVGERLSTLIARDLRRAAPAVETIAAWIVSLGASTAAPSATLADERRRLTAEVLPRWADQLDGQRLPARIPEVSAVLQHNDLGSWNIVIAPEGGFTALDWESARAHGFPLWDLLYFLADALPLLEGARTPEERAGKAVRILRGEARSSDLLFRWLRRAIGEAGIPEEDVGPLATLCWLHHGLSHVPRRAAAERTESGSGAVLSPIDRLAPLWLRDPALGVGWNAWRP